MFSTWSYKILCKTHNKPRTATYLHHQPTSLHDIEMVPTTYSHWDIWVPYWKKFAQSYQVIALCHQQIVTSNCSTYSHWEVLQNPYIEGIAQAQAMIKNIKQLKSFSYPQSPMSHSFELQVLHKWDIHSKWRPSDSDHLSGIRHDVE